MKIVLFFFQTFIFIIIIIFALIYSIPILYIRRFHQNNNILTLNVCLATILCSFSWLPINTMTIFDNQYETFTKIYPFFIIAEIIFTIQVPFSFVIVSIHRYCSIVYYKKIFFKTKQWIILCIGSQWILGFILTIPNITCFILCRRVSLWTDIYTFGCIVIIPSIICLIVNILLFYYVRSSSRRVQPQNKFSNNQQIKINHRDIYLLRHMALMFCIFIGGWTPTFLIPIILHYTSINAIVLSCFTIWCEVALLFDIIDLYLYNHEVRKYLKDICLRIYKLLRK